MTMSKNNSNIVRVVHALLKELRFTMATFYDDCGFWVQEKDGTRVEVFQLPDDAVLPDLKEEWMSAVDPDIERQAAEILSLLLPLTEALKSTATSSNITTNATSILTASSTTSIVQPPDTLRPVNQEKAHQKRQTVTTQPKSNAKINDNEDSTTAITAKTNYSGTHYFPSATLLDSKESQMNLPRDSNLLIKNIRLHPKNVTIEFENYLYIDIGYAFLPMLLQRTSASPTLSFSSLFKTKSMTATMLDHATPFMNENFWKYCRKVTFSGEFWLGPIISRIINTIPTVVTSLLMRQITFHKAYRLRWTVEKMGHLHHLNYDCRVTDNADFFNNIVFLEKINPKSLKSVILNVTGFPSGVQRFKQNQDTIQRKLQNGGYATILSEEHIDDDIYYILCEHRYTYCGTGSSQSAFSPFQNQIYDLFNHTLADDVKITIGLLQQQQ